MERLVTHSLNKSPYLYFLSKCLGIFFHRLNSIWTQRFEGNTDTTHQVVEFSSQPIYYFVMFEVYLCHFWFKVFHLIFTINQTLRWWRCLLILGSLVILHTIIFWKLTDMRSVSVKIEDLLWLLHETLPRPALKLCKIALFMTKQGISVFREKIRENVWKIRTYLSLLHKTILIPSYFPPIAYTKPWNLPNRVFRYNRAHITNFNDVSFRKLRLSTVSF